MQRSQLNRHIVFFCCCSKLYTTQQVACNHTPCSSLCGMYALSWKTLWPSDNTQHLTITRGVFLLCMWWLCTIFAFLFFFIFYFFQAFCLICQLHVSTGCLCRAFGLLHHPASSLLAPPMTRWVSDCVVAGLWRGPLLFSVWVHSWDQNPRDQNDRKPDHKVDGAASWAEMRTHTHTHT